MKTTWFIPSLSLLFVGCTTHIIGDADVASLQADARGACRIYRDIDAGIDRAFARAIYVDETAILKRSGVTVADAGPAGCEGQ